MQKTIIISYFLRKKSLLALTNIRIQLEQFSKVFKNDAIYLPLFSYAPILMTKLIIQVHCDM